MASISIEKNCLVFPDGVRVTFPFPVAEFIEFQSIVVVRLDVPIGKIFNENVFGVSACGDIVWQIKRRKYVYENCPYMNLLRSNSNIVAHNWDCLDLVLDPKTGTVIETVHSK
jgi:hypothetical protein